MFVEIQQSSSIKRLEIIENIRCCSCSSKCKRSAVFQRKAKSSTIIVEEVTNEVL